MGLSPTRTAGFLHRRGVSAFPTGGSHPHSGGGGEHSPCFVPSLFKTHAKGEWIYPEFWTGVAKKPFGGCLYRHLWAWPWHLWVNKKCSPLSVVPKCQDLWLCYWLVPEKFSRRQGFTLLCPRSTYSRRINCVQLNLSFLHFFSTIEQQCVYPFLSEMFCLFTQEGPLKLSSSTYHKSNQEESRCVISPSSHGKMRRYHF